MGCFTAYTYGANAEKVKKKKRGDKFFGAVLSKLLKKRRFNICIEYAV